MNSTKKKGIIAAIIVAILALTGLVFVICSNHKVYTELDYCKDIAKDLSSLSLKYFKCIAIEETEKENNISFRFVPKNNRSVDEVKCIDDVVKIKETINKYLNTNSNNELNNKYITVSFHLYADEYFIIKNYKKIGAQKKTSEVLFYDGLETPLSKLKNFTDAHTITLIVAENDDLTVLEDWDNLEYLNIIGDCLTEDKQIYLSEILPDCTIAYNWETFYAPTTNKEID